MNKIVKTLVVAVCAAIVSLPSFADTLCQRKNENPAEKYSTRVQAIRLYSGNVSCPRGFRKVGVLPSTADIEAISSKVFQANATSLTGPQGPQGPAGPEGARAGLPPKTIVLNTSSGYTCQKVDLSNYCDDADGCVIRLLVTDKLADVIAPYEAVVAMEEPAAQSYSKPGISFTILDHVRTNGATGSPWISSILDKATQYTLWAPIANQVAMTNYTHANCPGQNGLNGDVFSNADARSVSMMTSSRYVVKMTVFDN